MQKVIIDVREPFEFAKGHVSGARNIPPTDLLAGAEALIDVPKDSQIVVYCLSGSRSRAAIEILRDYGFTNLTNGINQNFVEQKYADLLD